MKQISSCDKSIEYDVFENIRPALDAVMDENGAKRDWLRIVHNKQYYSVIFQNTSVIFRMKDRSKLPFISVPTVCWNKYSGENCEKDYYQINLLDISDVENYIDLLQFVLQMVLDDAPTDFDCCSRYEQCSNERKCIHPNKEFAFGCRYRRNVKNGIIFYGENPTT